MPQRQLVGDLGSRHPCVGHRGMCAISDPRTATFTRSGDGPGVSSDQPPVSKTWWGPIDTAPDRGGALGTMPAANQYAGHCASARPGASTIDNRREDAMTEQSPPQPVQSPLTLVMTAKSTEDYVALQQIIHQMQSLPPEKNPIITALNCLANVHFARFVFLGNEQLAVITTYDGDFDSYINDFINEIGDVFNTLLKHVADSPPVPVQTYREEFLEFAHSHDLSCVGPFYTAYPDRTVLDILDLAS
jgi:hypothetical protein